MQEILKSPTFSEADSIRNICFPLKLLGIDHFFFHRIYEDGYIIHLSSDLIWGEYFLQKLFNLNYEISEITDHFHLKNNISLWEMNPHNQVWREGKEIFKAGNGITITSQESDDYKEISCFYGSVSNFKLNDFYISNIDILYNFITSFKDSAFDIIKKAESKRILLPKKYRITQIQNTDTTLLDQRNHFLASIKPKRFFLKGTYLTEREAECLCWLSKGKTSEEIGLILNTSKRTVEKHIEKMKHKLNCYTKGDLINLGFTANIKNFFNLPS